MRLHAGLATPPPAPSLPHKYSPLALPCPLCAAPCVQYVATVHSAFVEGEGGLVYDAAGRAYHPPGHFFTRTSPLQPLPQRSAAQAAAECERHAVLASVVQRYGHM